MFDAIRYLAYFLIFLAVIVVILKQSAGPRCQQCQKRVGKRGVQRSVYGEEQLICMDCNDRMKANDGVSDLNRMNY